MGMDPATLALLIPALGSIGTGAVTSAFAPSPFQQRHSFSGTSADPVKGLTDVQGALRNILAGAMTRANQPVTLPDAVTPADLPSFTGGGLPIPVGVRTNRADLTRPVNVPGLGLDAGTLGLPGSNGPGGTVGGAPNGPGTDFTPPNTNTPPPENRLPDDIGRAASPSTGAPLDPRAMAALQLLLHAAQPQQGAGA